MKLVVASSSSFLLSFDVFPLLLGPCIETTVLIWRGRQSYELLGSSGQGGLCLSLHPSLNNKTCLRKSPSTRRLMVGQKVTNFIQNCPSPPPNQLLPLSTPHQCSISYSLPVSHKWWSRFYHCFSTISSALLLLETCHESSEVTSFAFRIWLNYQSIC